MSFKHSLYRAMTRGALRPLAKPAYDLVISLELAWERLLDGASQPHIPSWLNSQLTAMIKTFERPQALRRLVASIRRRYPNLPVVVVDDSRQPSALAGVDLVTLPFDSGVSAGRNAGLARVTTPYILVLDDDFVFYRRTALTQAVEWLEAYPRIDILGGRVVNLPLYTCVDYRRGNLYPTNAPPTLPPGSQVGGLPVYDRVANFYIARTERLRLVGWDPQIKRLDHTEFFTRARGVLTSVFYSDLKCLHAPTPFDIPYMDHRMDYLLDQALIRSRYFRSPPGAS